MRDDSSNKVLQFGAMLSGRPEVDQGAGDVGSIQPDCTNICSRGASGEHHSARRGAAGLCGRAEHLVPRADAPDAHSGHHQCQQLQYAFRWVPAGIQ